MCTIPPSSPPPPPPLPPLVLLDTHSPTKSPKPDSQSPLSNSSDVCKWALEQNELWEACAKNNICVNKPPFRFKCNEFESILQVGPTCGLAALSMLIKGKLTVDEMLKIAQLEGLSNNGEIFSCKYMARLVEKVFDVLKLNTVKCSIKNGLLDKETVEELLKGAVMLVPYDADRNHSPCLKKGHTAHWALVCGVIVIEDKEDLDLLANNVYVLCKHGKSRFLAAWTLKDLANSNENLWEFSRRRGDDGLVYVLPEGGVGGENGLRDQYVVLEGIFN